MIRVLLVDDHQMFIDGVKSFLKSEEKIEVVGEALNRQQVLTVMQRQAIDVVLLDVRIPTVQDGEIICKTLKKDYPDTKVLMVTMFDTPEMIQKFLHYKANGYVLKDSGKDKLIGAIHAVYQNGHYYPNEILKKIIDGKPAPASEVHLTKREIEVLSLICKGLQDKEIAEQLHIDDKTVITHGRNIRKKTGLSNRVELSNYARDKGII